MKQIDAAWCQHLKDTEGDRPSKIHLCMFCEVGMACEWDSIIGDQLRLCARRVHKANPLATNRQTRFKMYQTYHSVVHGPTEEKIPLPWCVERSIKMSWPLGLDEVRYAFYKKSSDCDNH